MKRTDCQPERLTLYHYHELEETERQRVADHLAACPACREELEDLNRVLRLADTGRLEISNLERQQFTQRVSVAGRRRKRSRIPAWGLALSSATALGLALILLRPGITPQPQPPQQQSSRIFADIDMLQNFDMLDDLDLLENLDLLQEMGDLG
ncbi:hypothetical protein C2E25_00115 [Geothermobacter hydrogeniphilus]|uniref:Putative zinc-finger domain-containing protein n=1 Tax=Geothermobacter hydrogeniphilus TaxID=1969733 RepID=A0A2K2HEE8_9BACT|nr:zf-HC2 domain-containing protein [Geothermobacter hydrogeniphilus]PNU21672.1 hypothetical protein C2E25_00115 [Geothermobacter hydrogeniphilus]